MKGKCWWEKEGQGLFLHAYEGKQMNSRLLHSCSLLSASPALLRSADVLPRLAVWRVLHKDKVLSPRPHLVTERIRKAIPMLCTPAGFIPQQSLSSGGFWLPCTSGQTQAKRCLLAPALKEKRRPGLQTEPELVSTLQNHLLAVGADRRRAGRMQTCIPVLS